MPAVQTTHLHLLETLQALSEADGPPGREGTLRRLAARHLHPSMRHVRVSPLGSLYAERTSARGARLMLTAALDEPAFIVSHVDRDGIAWLHPSGRIDPDSCAGALIRFPGGLQGTIGVVSPEAGERGPARLLADLGADEREHAVRVGNMGVFATPWLAERTTIQGKALDSRLGAALALEVAGRTARSPNSLVLALTALGQLGHRAAQGAATELAPAAAITLGAYAADGKRVVGASDVRVGKGPVILLRSNRYVADSRLVEALREAAIRARIPYQLAVAAEDLTGAAAVQSSLDGIPTATVLVPCAGVGTPRQQLETRDLDAAAELLVRLVERPFMGQR